MIACRRFFPHVFFAALVAAHPVAAEFRTWTNKEGVKIEAEFVKADGDTVTLRLRAGNMSRFSQDKLSQEDQDFIKQTLANPPKEEVKEQAGEVAMTTKVPDNRKARWFSKIDRAKDEAKQFGLPMLVLFTGTDWCPYCVKLENDVLSKKEFKEFANKSLVLVRYDFAGGGQAPHREAAESSKEYSVNSYPTYLLLGADGKLIARGGGSASPETFIQWVDMVTKGKVTPSR